MPKDYKHPELSPMNNKRYERQEHTWVMEQFLATHPDLENSKKFLIEGKYLKKGVEIHHINQIPTDNRIENLWIYENKKSHAHGELTLKDCLITLIKKKQIEFHKGYYSIIQSLEINEGKSEIAKKENRQQINYKVIDLIRKKIKQFDWQDISDNWTVKNRKNQFAEEIIPVDPTKDCSEDNPLYKHKDWVNTLFKVNEFNLTDSRLGNLCGISRNKARYWRDRVHEIKGKSEWGYERIVDPSDGRIWIKVPKNYENPVVKKEDHQRRYMLEHRFIMENFLKEHKELEISDNVLIDGKYLKSECEVHHINLDCQDNRIENLHVFKNGTNHREAMNSLYELVDDLLKYKKIFFKDGKYYVNRE